MGCTPASASPAPSPTRIMLVGDSVTQGKSGDYTWRYRLWTHLQSVGANVDFVGPRDDLHDPADDTMGHHDYADPAFDQDHAGRWGMTMHFMDTPIKDLVTSQHPDVVVEMLGINDLLFVGVTPQQLGDRLRQFVTEARQGDPSVDLVLGRLSQTWYAGVPEYNEQVEQVAADMTTPASRIAVAETDAGYVKADDTYDDTHPNVSGEKKIAAAMGDALHELGAAAVFAPYTTHEQVRVVVKHRHRIVIRRFDQAKVWAADATGHYSYTLGARTLLKKRVIRR